MSRCIYIFILLIITSFYTEINSTIKLEETIETRLTPYNATYSESVKLFAPNEPYKGFWLENIKDEKQYVKWSLDSKDKTEYCVEAIVCVEGLKNDEPVNLVLKNNNERIECPIKLEGWQRVVFKKNLSVKKGLSDLSLTIKPGSTAENFNVKLFSLELLTPKTYQQKQVKALKMKADVDWMNEIPYGFFFHWNSKSMPMSGEQLTYNDAVNNFNTDQFAKMVNDCGGKLVFFTTTWAEYFFPAPIQTIDSILPGRTTKRDLIADLSKSLSKYDIRLILYYHVGHGDKEWWNLQGFTRNNATLLYQNVEKIIGEISMRYKNKIAGFWLDDGMGYYPNGASFERINEAAKRGYKDMAVCFNSWIFPKLTDFQDYYAGEIGLSVESAGKNNPYFLTSSLFTL